jgi:hypothetical protein
MASNLPIEEPQESWIRTIDDKYMVIVCATLIAGLAMFLLPNEGAMQIAGNVVSGLFGVAVGRSMT